MTLCSEQIFLNAQSNQNLHRTSATRLNLFCSRASLLCGARQSAHAHGGGVSFINSFSNLAPIPQPYLFKMTPPYYASVSSNADEPTTSAIDEEDDRNIRGHVQLALYASYAMAACE